MEEMPDTTASYHILHDWPQHSTPLKGSRKLRG